MKRSAIFLDRDGIINVTNIINKKPVGISTIEQFILVNGINELTKYFIDIGYLIFCVTNQPDIARKKIKSSDVDVINRYVLKVLPIEKLYMCPHDNFDNCQCRKPKCGMILQAKKEYNLDLNSSWIIGDRWSDIECGKSAKIKTIFVDYGYDEKLMSIPDIKVNNIRRIIYDKNFC